ncbi:response regulator [Chromobacterium sp. IIBBL 290-4]|uniref:response regulator n=1 Tax=Chromobacterium sp. IIBBL 290-4 TaxID=2953890 RepID=UPI0020B6A3AD|nr:response regulator [Chromobacterium sp. IIBBL 290-4]UTH74666.1 response regulator [Chromobacterium sp. IIBBL 290-4]
MKLTVGKNMALLVATALLGLSMLTALEQYLLEKVYDGANYANINAVPSLKALGDLRRAFQEVSIQTSRLVYAGDKSEQNKVETKLERARADVSQAIRAYEVDGCAGVSCFADETDRADLEREKPVWAQYQSKLDLMLAVIEDKESNQAKSRDLVLAMDPISDQLQKLIDEHVDYNMVIARKFSDEAALTKRGAIQLTLIISAAMLLAIGLLGWLTSRSILSRLGGEPTEAADIASRLAEGDLDVNIQLRAGDDSSLMARLQELVGALDTLASRAYAIGQGDLSQEVRLASNKDKLGIAINDMIRMLRGARVEDERRNWLKDGYGQISAALTGDLTTEQLADAAIGMIGRYLEAGRGVFYLYQDADKSLQLIGSYMYTERQHIGARFSLGEGAVGQVARERKPIILEIGSGGGEEAAPIVTGTALTLPRYTYTYPLLHEKEMVGVIELSSMQRFDERKLEFLASVSGMLASFLFVAEQRVHIRKLLSASEAAEKEMRQQSEQLRESNARMEEQQQQLQQQSEELQQSNAQMEEVQQQLRQQTEELQQTNAQMEESQQQLEQQNQELQESRKQQENKAQELEQASKYKSEFLANMSHELRTPLNSIILLSKMMVNDDQGKVDGEALKWAQVIHRSGEDLLRLINDVLDLSKVEAGRMDVHLATLNSAELCTELQGMFEHLASDKGLDFIIDDQLRADFVTDPDKLSQILRNLLTNAIKFTRQGSVTLCLARHEDTPLPISLTVKDTGIGIPEEKRGMIFEAFQQADGSTSREFGGTGLGLTISQRFAEMLGGLIELRSAPGQGSEFILWLPDAHAAANGVEPAKHHALPAAPADDRNQLHAGDRIILLIDDDPVFSRMLLTMNRRLGYKTLLAASGGEGLALAGRHRLSGILLDLSLPDMDGTQVLHEIKTRPELAGIPVYIVSARDRDEALLHQGAIGFLTKPASDQRLAAAEAELIRAVGGSSDGILVVERGGIRHEEVSELVGAAGGAVQAAPADADWPAWLQQHPARLAIIDLGESPAADSLATAAALRAAAPAIALVFFATQTPSDEDEAALRAYTDCVIVKTPQAGQRLLENVERFLQDVPRQQATQQNPPPAAGSKLLEGKRILVVDDDPRNLFVITAALERHGAAISNAVNGKRALEYLARERPDLVLMDIMMPEMDGYQTIAEIRAHPDWASLPVVAITAKALPTEREKILNAGADDYLSKPVDYDLLVAKASQWSGGRGR